MSFTERFGRFFDREVAQKAAKSMSNGAEIQFHVGDEVFTFTRVAGKNAVVPSSAKKPQIIFTLSPKAAEGILDYSSEDIGEIGIHIAKMVVSKDPDTRVAVQFKSGFLGLFTQGYFGVLTAGGAGLASFLASHGLNGISGIKRLLK
jgi:hypothetical protein